MHSSGGRMQRVKQMSILGAALVGALFLYRVRGILTPFLVGAAIAYLANPFVVKLEQREVPRPVAIILVYMVLAVIVILAFYLILPNLINELNQVLALLPRQTDKLENITRGAVGDLRRLRLPANLQEIVDGVIGRAEQVVQQFARRLVDFILAAFSRLFSLLLAPVLAYYLLRDWEDIGNYFMKIIPAQYRSDCLCLLQEVNSVLNGFIRGQLIVSAIVGGLITLGLVALQIRFATLLGLTAGLFDVIPYFGPFIGAIPALIFALIASPWKALWVIVLFVVVNQVEGAILTPRVVGGRVGLPPIVTIFVLLAGGHLFGIGGILLAVPVAATLRVLVRFAWQAMVKAGPS